MKRLKISIIDLIHNGPSQSIYRRVMFPNYISIMPQIIGVWCKEEGHIVNYSIFTGHQRIKNLLDDDTDMVFISSFTYTAQLAYALSNYFRTKGIVTVLGGPHARSYPADACNYFDYVMGLANKELLKDLLQSFEINRPYGITLSAQKHPVSIPGAEERWEFIEQVHKQSKFIKITPLIGSFGCPYHCNFCIDSAIPYQALDSEMIKNDLQFLMKKFKHPIISWYDPNFGIKFNSVMETIESVVPPGSADFVAECSLSVLSESNVQRMKKNGFKMLMPGIESWMDYDEKTRIKPTSGLDKVLQVADQVNMIQKYIPQVQTNFLLGLDSDIGDEPFTLTKRFIDLAPAAYPSYALLSIYGEGVKNNIKYEHENRIIPFPFHMLMSVHVLNIIPLNYSWEEFYIRYIDLLKYSFSAKAMQRRFNANKMAAPRWLTLLLSMTIGGRGKIKHLSTMVKNLQQHPDFKSFVMKENSQVPNIIINKVKQDLGEMWHWLPDKTLSYNPNVITGNHSE